MQIPSSIQPFPGGWWKQGHPCLWKQLPGLEQKLYFLNAIFTAANQSLEIQEKIGTTTVKSDEQWTTI